MERPATEKSETMHEDAPLAGDATLARDATPAGDEQPESEWAATFTTDISGLQQFTNMLLKEEKLDVPSAFFCCYQEVFGTNEGKEEATEAKETVHNTGQAFYRSYLEWKGLLSQNPNDPKGQLAFNSMAAHLHHCFKELYQIGSATIPAINFCGSVNAKAMLPKGPFEGYNERGLSVKDALELKGDMLRAYLGDGHESIALMFMKPVIELAFDPIKGWAVGEVQSSTKQFKKELVEQFCSKSYSNSSMVPFLMIPTCGKLYFGEPYPPIAHAACYFQHFSVMQGSTVVMLWERL
jgi:hypothetical protein